METKSLNYTIRTENFDRYLTEIRQYDTLTADEETEIITEYQKTKDIKLRDKLVMANQRFVLSMAKKYSSNGNTILELVDVGTIGLLEAIEKFDITRGFKLLTFAADFIKREMSQYLINTRFVKQPNYQRFGYRINRLTEKFLAKNERYPEKSELVEMIEKESGYKIKNDSDLTGVYLSSIDSSVSVDDENTTIGECGEVAIKSASYNEYEKDIEKDSLKEGISKILLTINNDRDRDIVKMYYGIDYDVAAPIEEIADKYNVTEMRVSQILKSSIEKMSKYKKYIAV